MITLISVSTFIVHKANWLAIYLSTLVNAHHHTHQTSISNILTHIFLKRIGTLPTQMIDSMILLAEF